MTSEEIQQEEEANEFAMHLLMPSAWVRDYLIKHRIDLCNEKAIKVMADKFKVPTSLMAVRIGQVMKEKND
jgi:Zn-dependent peptidase ImmA (M78 family)